MVKMNQRGGAAVEQVIIAAIIAALVIITFPAIRSAAPAATSTPKQQTS
ncbi:MAG: hypothetical protein HPY90_12115 [Syntrophothermus sp.]|nr:hypothetical protein [Syntrophothermus sp.]NSW83994.1 hypothetical protein [Syntrophothermus sp.]